MADPALPNRSSKLHGPLLRLQRLPVGISITSNRVHISLQTCVVVSAGWTLTIAIVTYSTLVRPMSRLTMAIESPRAFYWIWGIVWSLGLIPAIFGTVSSARALTSSAYRYSSPHRLRFRSRFRSSSPWWMWGASAGTRAAPCSPKL